MAGDQDKKESGTSQPQTQPEASTPTSPPKTEVVPPTFEIVVKSEKGRKAVVPGTDVNNQSE